MTDNERLARLEQWVQDHQQITGEQVDKIHATQKLLMTEIRQNNQRLLLIENRIMMYTRFVLWTGIGIGGFIGVIVRNWNHIHGLLHKI